MSEPEPHQSPAIDPPGITDAPWLNSAPVQAVFAALNSDGCEARAVGGAVRNALMGLGVTDVDLAATAPPGKVMELARRAGLKAVPTGIDHGTVTVIAGHHPFEVTTLRQDVETYGRRAKVAFTGDWTEDARRRDFTMNALYAGADGAVYDPLGGYADILARRLRFIGSAEERIREDYLRILRFFRFNADYGDGEFDADGLRACVRERAGLASLSAERVKAELFRLLAARRAVRAVEIMYDYGLLPGVLGGVPRLQAFARLAEIENELGLKPDAVRRLAALTVMVMEDAEGLVQRLRLSRAEGGRLKIIAAIAPKFAGKTGEQASKTALYRLGAAPYRDRLLSAWAHSGEDPGDKGWRGLYALPERWAIPQFPIKAANLLTLGVKKGPHLGRLLRELEAKWMEGGFAASREELLQAAKALGW